MHHSKGATFSPSIHMPFSNTISIYALFVRERFLTTQYSLIRRQGRNLHSILRRGENQKMKKNETAKKAKNKTSGGLRKSNSASECNESDLLQPREEERNKKKKRFSTALTELWPSSSDQQQQQQQQFPSGAFRLEGNSISFRKEGDGKNENGDEDHHNNAGKQQKCTKWTKSCSPSPRCRPTSLNLNAAPSPKKLKMCRMEMNKCCKKKKGDLYITHSTESIPFEWFLKKPAAQIFPS